jgi:tetratricopeptide (TPR) repeat protein
MQPDVLMLDRVGGAYTHASLLAGGLGGSEIEVLQVARGLTAKGQRVVVANGVDAVTVEEGITFVPHAQAWQHVPSKALYLQRCSTPETRLDIPAGVRIVVRANDVYCPPYDVHRVLLESGRASLVANTEWQAAGFTFAKETTIIPPMLEPLPKVKKERGLFVFASGAMKGFEETVARWMAIYPHRSPVWPIRLLIVVPGWGAPRPLTDLERAAHIQVIEHATPAEYRRWIAKAEGLFMVLTMPETFCCAAALASRAHTRTHILCLAGLGGIPEAVDPRDLYYVTEDPTLFEARFHAAFGTKSLPGAMTDRHPVDLSPETVIDRWVDVLVKPAAPVSVESTFATDPGLAKNQEPLGPFFGDFLSILRGAIAPGGSEFGAGLMLFSLAASIQAREIVEIGRFKGFSTLALAASARLVHEGWHEPAMAQQRPDVDYVTPKPKPRVLSIDPAPQFEALGLLKRADVLSYVDLRDVRSDAVTPDRPIDLLFIDGGHAPADIRSDLHRFVPWVRPGGYFILHDYFGWFTSDGQNGSPIAQVIAEELTGCDRVLIDTHYASLVIFRKAKNLTDRWELDPQPSKIPARADGRPTVGLVIIAKGDEASTVATRAIVSGKKAGVDCVTVVCDANDATADVARSLGADVFIRPSPAIDWTRGLGVIAGARNEALAIAERRTDYILMLDADDALEGALPAVLDRDAYEVTIHDAHLNYPRIQLFRASLGWRYTGIIHESLTMVGASSVGKLSDVKYLRGKSSYGYQDQDPPAIKFSKHAHLAKKWLIDHPDDTRMQFYLGRSYHDAGRLDEALVAYADRVAMVQGWHEERAYAAYQMGIILIQQGKDPTAAFLQSHAIDPTRAEPLVALARWYRDDARRQFSTAYAFALRAAELPAPVSGIFMQPAIYEYEAAAEVAICAYWLGKKQEALDRFTALAPHVPAQRKAWADEMIAMCRRELAGR